MFRKAAPFQAEAQGAAGNVTFYEEIEIAAGIQYARDSLCRHTQHTSPQPNVSEGPFRCGAQENHQVQFPGRIFPHGSDLTAIVIYDNISVKGISAWP